jgi:rubrerythrin
MSCYFVESTLLYSDEKGFGEAYYIICPVCWNASIMFKYWEDGTEEAGECPVCERMIRALNDDRSEY